MVLGRPLVKRFALCYRTVVLSVCLSVCLFVCLSCLSVTLVYCGQTVGRIKMKFGIHVGRPRSWPHCGRCGPRSPSPKGAQPLQFSAHICCCKMARYINMPLGRKVDLDPSDIVLDGGPVPFGHNRHGPKIGEGARSPSNTTRSSLLRPTSMPNTILIHPAVWPQ